MIYLVHGDDVAKARALIANQQKKLEIEKRIELDLNDKSVKDMLEATNGSDLFGNIPFVVAQVPKNSKTIYEELATNLHKVNAQSILILLFDKEITKTNPINQKIPELNIKTMLVNKVPEGNVFKFVDALFSKNRSDTYRELENLLKEDTDNFYILSMITYGIRNMATVAFESPGADKMNPYVKTKTKGQLKNFTLDNIKKIYTDLFNLDKQAKTGITDPDIALTLAIEKVLNS